VKFAAAYGTWIIKNHHGETKPRIVVGRDARVSGEMIASLVMATLQGLGIDIIDLGLSTTPTVEIAVPEEQAQGGIILTASHNPGNWNALKLLNAKGEFISEQEGQGIVAMATQDEFEFAPVGQLGKIVEKVGYIDRHIEKILALPEVDIAAIQAKDFRVIIDCVNSTGGLALPKLLSALGVRQVTQLHCEPTGKFPHNPEPLPENITEICSKMEAGNYHLGIVVDPDVDRLVFVCEDGTPFGEEYTLVAVADYILQQRVGNTVSNMSSTRALRDITEKAGGQYTEAAVGEVNVVNAMKETQAVIGGEGNGGVIFPDLHYGRDALVGIALFLSHLAKFKGSAKMLRMRYPNYVISKNKIELSPEINVDQVLLAIQQLYKNHPISTKDGVKIYFEKEWVQLRKSNTEPIIRIYAESDSPATADYLANKIINDMKDVIWPKSE
jgi:phosphomannomutase